jgi:hypothetical protein
MFYPLEITSEQAGSGRTSAMAVLNPAESRRLLARAAAACPEVRRAWSSGTIIVARGITNAFLLEELFGEPVLPKAAQTVGLVGGGMTTSNSGPPPDTRHVIRQGKPVENADSAVEIQKFGPGDVFVKGANAVDPSGTPGIYVSSVKAGTIGMAWPVLMARRCDLIVPVSLEKAVFSVQDSARHTGIYRFERSTGLPVTLIPVPEAKVITEVQALGILAGVRAYHIGSGGVGGSEGSVHLSIEGERSRVDRAFELVSAVKGEPPVGMSEEVVLSSPGEFDYNAAAQLKTLGGV